MKSKTLRGFCWASLALAFVYVLVFRDSNIWKAMGAVALVILTLALFIIAERKERQECARSFKEDGDFDYRPTMAEVPA